MPDVVGLAKGKVVVRLADTDPEAVAEVLIRLKDGDFSPVD